MIYTLTCNPAIDYLMHTKDIRIGSVNRSSTEEFYIGGKGINVSTVLSELSVPNTAFGFVAGFTGNAIEQGLRNQGISCDFIHLKNGFSRINVKIRADEETEINGQGPPVAKEDISRLFQKLDALVQGDTLVLAGSVPNSLPHDFYEQILHRLSDRGIRFVVDAEGELLLRVLKYRPFLIKPNNHELGALFGRKLHGIGEIGEYARRLQAMGARNVLVSMAGDGALLIDEDGIQHFCAACKGVVRNSVGAGDSMVAGFLAGLQSGDYAHALMVGTATGGATAFSDGLAVKTEIDALLEILSERGRRS